VRYLAGAEGIRQFLDIGPGLHTTLHTHEVAQAIVPACRVVYVDHDPLVLAHARALLTSTPPGRTDYLPICTVICAIPTRSCARPPGSWTSPNRSRCSCWESWTSWPMTRKRTRS